MKHRIINFSLITVFTVLVGFVLYGFVFKDGKDQIAKSISNQVVESLKYQDQTLSGIFPRVKDGYSVLLILEDEEGHMREFENSKDGASFRPNSLFTMKPVYPGTNLHVQVWKTPVVEEADKVFYTTTSMNQRKDETILSIPDLHVIQQGDTDQ